MEAAGANAGTGDKSPTVRQHTRELVNPERQNSSMSVTVCRRRSSAQDFLREGDLAVPIRESMMRNCRITFIRSPLSYVVLCSIERCKNGHPDLIEPYPIRALYLIRFRLIALYLLPELIL